LNGSPCLTVGAGRREDEVLRWAGLRPHRLPAGVRQRLRLHAGVGGDPGARRSAQGHLCLYPRGGNRSIVFFYTGFSIPIRSEADRFLSYLNPEYHFGTGKDLEHSLIFI